MDSSGLLGYHHLSLGLSILGAYQLFGDLTQFFNISEGCPTLPNLFYLFIFFLETRSIYVSLAVLKLPM